VPVAPVYRDDPRLDVLIGAGGPFEVADVVVDGVPLRDFVRAPATIVDVFAMGAAHEALVAIVHGDERWTFADVRRRSLSLARELQTTLGVAPGDRVAVAMRNLPVFVVSFWGTVLAGAVSVPLNGWWTGEELAYAISDAGASVVLADGERLERIVGHGRADGVPLIGVRSDRGDLAFDDLTAGDPIAEADIPSRARDDPIALLYTSGTTGRPKGALITNRSMMANLWNMAFASTRDAIISERPPRPPRQSASLSTGPLFHIGGISAIVGGQMGGSKMVLMPRWDLDEALRLAREEDLTALGGVPAVARQILEAPGLAALGLDIRNMPMGGAPVPPDLPGKAIEVFGPHVQILNGYGLTETTSAVATNVGRELEAHPDSVGRLNLTADLQVVDAEGRVLADGEIGELCFRSPQVVRGYWNDEAATKASFRDGWFHSGDIGFVDADGFLHVVDRLKDVVIRGGENVYCVEVEDVLHEHPAIAEVAVIGLPERALGERVCAVVVLRPGAALDLAALRAFAAERLAAFKCPEALHLTDELPATPTGKVAKAAVRAALAEAAAVEKLW
jgi:acyl-CoA synthetase (AMP-forming)/AMP-acid ligase II